MQVFLVGKDFGARVAHHFALLHQERIFAVVTLGVPFLPSGPEAFPIHLLPKGFYMLRWRASSSFLCFISIKDTIFDELTNWSLFPNKLQEPGRPEKDFGRFPVKTVVKNIYILFSGSELPVANDEEQEIMDMVDPSTPLPPWFSEEDLHQYAALYEKSGFQTALQVPYR